MTVENVRHYPKHVHLFIANAGTHILKRLALPVGSCLYLLQTFFKRKQPFKVTRPTKYETVLTAVERKEALCLGFSSNNTLKEEAKSYFQQARCH